MLSMIPYKPGGAAAASSSSSSSSSERPISIAQKIGPAADNPLFVMKLFRETLKSRPLERLLQSVVRFLQVSCDAYATSPATNRHLIADGDVGLMLTLSLAEGSVLKTPALRREVFGGELLDALTKVDESLGGALLMGEGIFALVAENLLCHVIAEWMETHAKGLTRSSDVPAAEALLRKWNERATLQEVPPAAAAAAAIDNTNSPLAATAAAPSAEASSTAPAPAPAPAPAAAEEPPAAPVA
eukprot:jgi/Mesen1/3513/ME000197S02533